MSRRGSKTPKTGEKCPVLRVRLVNSHMKLQFLLIRGSGRTPRTLFPPLESAFFRSEAAKKNFVRKPNLKKARLSEKRNMLNMCISHAFFAPISKSEGSKTPKTGKTTLSFEGSTCKFPYKTAFFAYKAIWPNPPNFFSPSRICVFPVRSC